MTFLNGLRHLAILVLLTLHACNAQTQDNTKSVVDNVIPLSGNSDGIVYFSYDKGLTWKNESIGLPQTIKIGLGGIAVSENKLALLSKDSGLYFFNDQKGSWINIPTDKELLESNPGALLFFKDRIYAGTQFAGVFYTEDEGQSWTKLNTGLDNLSIRKFASIENKLYAATNSGLYSYNESLSQWDLEYGHSSLQVNGITAFDGNIYIASNQGGFNSVIGKKDWKKIFSEGALHNISSDDKGIYAMMYNELFSSCDKGKTWQSIQSGLPAELYTFNVIKKDNTHLAGQWDGVYRKDKETENWKFSGTGLPEKFAVTNMKSYNDIIVVSGAERNLKSGLTTDK